MKEPTIRIAKIAVYFPVKHHKTKQQTRFCERTWYLSKATCPQFISLHTLLGLGLLGFLESGSSIITFLNNIDFVILVKTLPDNLFGNDVGGTEGERCVIDGIRYQWICQNSTSNGKSCDSSSNGLLELSSRLYCLVCLCGGNRDDKIRYESIRLETDGSSIAQSSQYRDQLCETIYSRGEKASAPKMVNSARMKEVDFMVITIHLSYCLVSPQERKAAKIAVSS